MRIKARYSAFGLYETAILGILASGSGWATAARRIVDAADPIPVIGFGARHVHPSVADQMDYASVVGGCIGASTPAGARLAGLAPTGTMPHALVLIFGDTVRAAEAFDRHIDPEVPRIILVDTFKDEAEESLRVAEALGDRLWGVRLDTPSERGRVTPELVKEVRARLDLAGHPHVKIVVSGGLDVDRIGVFKDAGAPVDSFAVGSYISKASPIDFTGDLKEIDGRPVAKRGRIPGLTREPPAGADRPPALGLTDAAHAACARGARVRLRALPARLAHARRPPPRRRGRPAGARAGARAWQGLDPRGARPGLLQPGRSRRRRRSLRGHRRGRSGGALRALRPRPVEGAAGRDDGARRHLRMAVLLKPENEAYRRALDRLGDAA